jgi:hypothetical protein
MRVERTPENVFRVTATSQELSALVAAARMALEAMRDASKPPPAEASRFSNACWATSIGRERT